MLIKDLLTQVETASQPVGKMLRKGEHFHVLAIGFKKDMILAEHVSHLPARLVVVKGAVVYNDANGPHPLDLYDEFEIPVDDPHWVEAKEDSLIFVIKGHLPKEE